MIPDAIISCGYVLLGSGYCVYRLLVKHFDNPPAKVSPQFIIASIGIMAIGARSMHSLFYNLFWRSYPIDPMLIAEELKEIKNDKNYLDWILSKAGTASLVYSFYYRYNFAITGAVIVAASTVFEAFCLIEEIISSNQANDELFQASNAGREIASVVKSLPLPPETFWILSTELLGRAVGNPLCRLANVPYALSTWAFPRRGFYRGWSMNHTINDYIMLAYIIVITEALCQTPMNR